MASANLSWIIYPIEGGDVSSSEGILERLRTAPQERNSISHKNVVLWYTLNVLSLMISLLFWLHHFYGLDSFSPVVCR